MTSKKIAKIKLQRGVESERVQRTFKESELVYSIDKERMFIGDEQTKGGILVSNRNYVVNSLNGVLNLPKSIFYGDIVNDKSTNKTYIIGYAADGVTLTPYIISDGNCLNNLNKRLKQLIDTILRLDTDDQAYKEKYEQPFLVDRPELDMTYLQQKIYR